MIFYEEIAAGDFSRYSQNYEDIFRGFYIGTDYAECRGASKWDRRCDDNSYWNPLACECFSIIQCDVACLGGAVISPITGCDCVSEDWVRSLYPEISTDEDIMASQEYGISLWEQEIMGGFDDEYDPWGIYGSAMALRCISLTLLFTASSTILL